MTDSGDTEYVDVSDLVSDFDEAFFSSGGIRRLEDAVADRVEAGATRALDGKRIGAPIARPHQILCIGLNYSDHAAETGQAVPEEPILFNKAPNTLVGPNDTVLIPRGSTKPDWEVELGVVIGSRCRYLADEQAALSSIAGFVLVNDVSERAFQLERAPSLRTLGPLGCGSMLTVSVDSRVRPRPCCSALATSCGT